MNRLPRLLALVTASLVAAGCQGPGPREPGPREPRPAALRPAEPRPRATSAELATWLTGSFSSANQAAADPENYFDIRLFAVPIWEDEPGGPWLYVEQASASALERPYRQRVYHLVETEEGVRSDVFTLPGDPLEMAGAWRFPETFGALSPDDLALREGCSIHLTREGNAYLGATRGQGCASSLGDAAYATSQVVISPTALTSWDRGFDAAGRQAWGATEGAYIFERTSDI